MNETWSSKHDVSFSLYILDPWPHINNLTSRPRRLFVPPNRLGSSHV